MNTLFTTFFALVFYNCFSQLAYQPVISQTITLDRNGYEELKFGLREGDKINFQIRETEGNRLTSLAIVDDNGQELFGARKVSKLEKEIFIPATAIYTLKLNNDWINFRHLDVKIERMPSDSSGLSFDTHVYQRIEVDTNWFYKDVIIDYDTTISFTKLNDDEGYRLASRARHFLGKDSHTGLPIKLPENTVELIYKISTGQDSLSANTTAKSIGLVSELAGRVYGFSELGNLASLLTSPNIGNPVNVYLVDHANFLSYPNFRYISLGSRKGFKGGYIEVEKLQTNTLYYIIVENLNNLEGINVNIEAVAVIQNIKPIKEKRKLYKIKKRTVNYLKN